MNGCIVRPRRPIRSNRSTSAVAHDTTVYVDILQDRFPEKDRLGLMLEFTNKLVTKLDLCEPIRTVASSVHRVIPCDLVAIFLPDSKPNLLRSFVVDFPASKGFILEESQDPSSRHSFSADETLAARVFRTGKAWAGTDNDLLQLGLKNDPGIAEGLKSVSVWPVVCCDKVLGQHNNH